MPPTDDTLEPGEQLIDVVDMSALVPGSAIRAWHRIEQRWIPGWWCEVPRIEGNRVYLRDLQTGEENDRSIEGTVKACVYRHPAPERLRGLGQARAEAKRARLDELEDKFYALNLFCESTEAEMIEVLRSELKWRDTHDQEYSWMKAEFDIREKTIVAIGEQLDHLWDGIGGWMG